MIPADPDLNEVFRALRPPPDTGAATCFASCPISSLGDHRIAKDTGALPAFLVSVGFDDGLARGLPVRLDNVAVDFDVPCRVWQAGRPAFESRFAVIRCTGADPALHPYFIRAVAAVVVALGQAPRYSAVVGAIDRLVELFHALTQPPRKSVQGLWAELLVIAGSREPAVLLRAWHSTPEDRWDFSAEHERLEVKGASRPTRQHHFSLEQLHPPSGTSVAVASVFVERAGGGQSVLDLMQEIRARIGHDPEMGFQLEHTVALTLGSSWRSTIADRFDRQVADDSLAFYDAGAIPSVDPRVPNGVSEVRFRADLNSVQPITRRQWRGCGELLRSASRR